MGVDELDYLGSRGSSSRAKKAEAGRDPAALRAWAGRIGARYLGVDETDRLAELNGAPGNVLVRVRLTRIVSENSITE